MTTLRMENLSREVAGRTLLNEVSLTFQEGKINLLLGPNGAGKTTLLRICAGLDPHHKGSITLLTGDGHGKNQETSYGKSHGKSKGDGWSGIGKGKNKEKGKAVITMVFQRPVLFNRSVRANIAYPLRVRGESWAEIEPRVEEALALANLTPLANRNARSLSGGEAQRLTLARAYVMAPSLLLLDEPAANLDPESRWRVEAMVAAMRERYGTTVVMTTHDLLQARKLGDAVFFIERGRVAGPFTTREFFHDPPGVAAARFISGVLHLGEE